MFFFGIGVELKGHLPAEDGDGRLETLGPLGCWMICALPRPLREGVRGLTRMVCALLAMSKTNKQIKVRKKCSMVPLSQMREGGVLSY